MAEEIKKALFAPNRPENIAFARKYNLYYMFFEQTPDMPFSGYCFKRYKDVFTLKEDDDKDAIICYDYTTKAEKYRVIFHKNNPETSLEYISPDTYFKLDKNNTQEIKIKNKLLNYKIDMRHKKISSSFGYKFKHYDIFLSNKSILADNQEKIIYHYYTEKTKTKGRGLFLNETANGDNHTGVIAFPLQIDKK